LRRGLHSFAASRLRMLDGPPVEVNLNYGTMMLNDSG
jgi:hypothetical protein